MIGKSNAVLLALLLALPTAFMATAYIAPAVGEETYSAWLKIVTDSWDGTDDTTLPGSTTPVMPVGIDFPGRYNVTNVCVELYRFTNPDRLSPAPLNRLDPPRKLGSPNATGFIQITWPRAWENLTVIVYAKSYQGECIGGDDDDPFTGIIVYWLTVGGTTSFLQRFFASAANNSYTVGDDGIIVEHRFTAPHKAFNFNVPAPFRAGPVDRMNITPPVFALAHSDPRNASVAHAAYIFKLFHEHTWYGTDDVLTYATIFIYDTDHTPASSTQSLIQAAITSSDGQSRYTREIYPRAQGLGPSGRFRDNKLVPIPLQTINRFNATPFHGGIGDPQDPAPVRVSNIGAPHLNATKRVWWETVLVNQTLYVGREYNGTAGNEYASVAGTGKLRPLFGAYPSDLTLSPNKVTQGGITGVPAGPFSIALNNTVHLNVMTGGLWSTWDSLGTQVNVADFNNNTVFYARFCVQDADLHIQHPEVGDKLVGAEVTVNLKRTGDVQPYYLSHNILETDASGCTATPHKWPGYRSEFSKFARFPNATNWGLRGSLNVSKYFDPRDDVSPVWRPGGYFERAWGGAWTGPYVNAGRNWSALIPEITYMKTRTLTDDPDYNGFDVQVKWKGGSRNNYGGTAVLVDSIRVPNPYAIALLYDYVRERPFGGWVFPYTVLANNKLWLQIHRAASVTIGSTTITDPNPTKLEVMGPFRLTITDFDSNTGRFTVVIRANGFVAVNNATDRAKTVDWALASGGSIVIEDALVSFKKHDVMSMEIAFEAGQGQADRGVDGSDDYTTVDVATVDGGPYELEFWPGPQGTGTVRVLVTGHDLNICILPNNLNRCPNIRDFTGAILFKGPPRVVELLTASDPTSGSFSGEFNLNVESVPTPGKIYDGTVTGGTLDATVLPSGMTGTLTISFTTTMDVGVRNDVDLAGTLELSVSGEFSDPRPNVGVLHGTVTGSLTLRGDFDGDGESDEATATASGSIFCSQIYAETQTNNEQCSLAIAFNGQLLGETISGILEIRANVADTLAPNGDITLSLESGTVSGMFAWKATQVTPGKFDATRLQDTPAPQISFTFYPEGMTGTASLALNTMADVQVVQWTYTFDSELVVRRLCNDPLLDV
jgi:hypothetical protein